MISYTQKLKSDFSKEELSWNGKQWDKQDILYVGKETVEQYGFAKNTKHGFVACENDKIVGVLILAITNRVGLIYSIIIDPEYRGKGIGRELMRLAEKFSRKEEIVYLWLETREEWVGAYNLYLSLDFEVTQKLPVFYFGLPWVRMGKKL